MKTILKRIPSEDVYYNFEEAIDFNGGEDENILIYGNQRFQEFGEELLLDVLKGDYYDDDTGYNYEPLKELEKLTGKKWYSSTLRGYSQSDWQNIYFTEDVSKERIEELEDYYMGKVDAFEVFEDSNEDEDNCDYIVYIPHSIIQKGKNAICRYGGIRPEDTTILIDDGYTKVYKYKEMK